ncbi:hypothetical protein SAMN04488543_3917 [Friedmanniella luteola]|uniref:Uncharacterized protein n=1 Tax=Friedmanniella luteola TaxID=546871 RepID=A0A1H1ZPW6_9ACTN|nr:hypothetical protein [Friedmanniella luteola]SDT35649.1 hypothetical protein SAMN04488543_3917 [Friedmanniella luteola]
MDPWSIGLAVLVVVGLAAVVFGALYDRARNRRRAAEMLAPPDRVIPHFRADAPTPHYLSELQARRPAEEARPAVLDDATRAEVERQLAADSGPDVGSGWASADFVTDAATGWAVLEDPVVLVCADEVASLRELLGLLERLLLSRTPLVLVAPRVSREVLATLEVNRIRGLLAVVVVLVGDPAARDALASGCGATAVDRADRQAGYLPPEALGRCRRWVSTDRRSLAVTRETSAA